MDKNEALIRLSEGPHVVLDKVPFEKQNPIQRVFTAIWQLEADVNNGGFHQYFFNSSGDSAGGVLEALNRIGAKKTARIVRAAIDAFPGGVPPANRRARQARLKSADESAMTRWEELDQEFSAYPDSLTDLLYAFVKDHPEEFGPVK